MKQSFVKKSSNAFFENKRAILIRECANAGGETLTTGSIVTILGKNARNKEWLNIQAGAIYINGVDPEALQILNIETDLNNK